MAKSQVVRVTAKKGAGKLKGKRVAVGMDLRVGHPSGFVSHTHFEGPKKRGRAGFEMPQMDTEGPMPHADLQSVHDHINSTFGGQPAMPAGGDNEGAEPNPDNEEGEGE